MPPILELGSPLSPLALVLTANSQRSPWKPLEHMHSALLPGSGEHVPDPLHHPGTQCEHANCELAPSTPGLVVNPAGHKVQFVLPG